MLLLFTDSTNTTFFTSNSFRNRANIKFKKKKVSFKHLFRELNSEHKSYLVESACEVDNNLPSSVIINYLEFTNVTCRRTSRDTDNA